MAMAKTGALRALEDRLRRLLSLGLTISISSLHQGTRRQKVWKNSDVEMQGQSVRAIQAFVKSHKSKLQSIEKNLLDDIISALEGLLKAESEQVYRVAVEVTTMLITSGGVSFIGSKFQGVYAPLVHLLLCSNTSTITSCATSLRVIITNLAKSREGIGVEDLWKAFKDMNVLNILGYRLQTHERFDGEGSSLYIAIADLLSAICHFWKVARFSLGSNSNFQKYVLFQCANINEAVSSAALRLCAALALCGGVASLQVQDSDAVSTCLVTNTNPSRSCNIRAEAFHFLYTLTRSCALSTLFSESLADTVCKNIVYAISEGLEYTNSRWPSDVKNLVLKASQAAQGLLRLPGNHHHSFWRAGFSTVSCNLLLDIYDAGVQSHVQKDIAVITKSAKYDAVLGPVLWDALGWLFINAPTSGEETLLRTKQQVALISRTVDFACAILLKVVDRRGIDPDLKHLQDLYCTGLEGVLICKVVLFLLYSPSHHLSDTTKCRLELRLQQHGYDWLPSFVSKLSLTFSSGAATENMITVMSLIATSCLSVSAHCHRQLLEHGVLDVFVEVIKAHSFTNLSLQTRVAATTCFYIPIDLNMCCCNNLNIWEGSNPILFFTLWGFANLARGSNTAQKINAALKKRFSNPLNWSIMPDEDIDSHLLVLAGSRKVAEGIRWWASCCLASCGLFGFPSDRSQLSKLFNDINTADVHLIFSSGNRLYAHKVIIAIKCPDLLPCSKQAASQGRHPMELNLSARIHEASMKTLLEFIYTGLAFIDEELVADVKLLAKRCHMDTFFRLLEGKMPVWGSVPDIHDFTTAVGSKGCNFADIYFEDKDNYQVGCDVSKGDVGHQHAHRAILSAQCSYFEGLFRSGMQDSIAKVLKVPLDIQSLRWLLQYLYSSTLPQKQIPEAGCMWSSLFRSDQIKHLKLYVELSQVAQQWLLEDLNEQCMMVVLDLLAKNLHLGTEVIKLADMCEQWRLLEGAIECIARDYPQMRDNGELDALDEYLADALRAAHVRMSMDYQEGIENGGSLLL